MLYNSSMSTRAEIYREVLQAGTEAEPIGLYVHVPFCKTKCPYCDFNTYAGLESLMGRYLDSLSRAIHLWGETLVRPSVATVFFGGGTPSYLPHGYLAHLMDSIRGAFQVLPGAEVTAEANPGDLGGPALAALLQAGINRLSIGVQSLDDGLLRLLGRRHSALEAVEAYRLAREVGFQRVNLDLMYGIPHQSLEQWRDTLERVLEMGPPHLSLYCLTLEEGTPMHRWVERGQLPRPDDDLAADMYLLAEEVLAGAGYHHYEISNWALPGYECAHNLIYWRNLGYLGVGPGAHSSLHGYRFHELKSPRLYMQQVQRWAAQGIEPVDRLDGDALAKIPTVADAEAIDRHLEMAETMFLGLRLLDGLSLRAFRERFGVDPLELYGGQVEELMGLGLLERVDGLLRLTAQGRLLANQVFMRFLD